LKSRFDPLLILQQLVTDVMGIDVDANCATIPNSFRLIGIVVHLNFCAPMLSSQFSFP
jgi:hypothetical protein